MKPENLSPKCLRAHPVAVQYEAGTLTTQEAPSTFDSGGQVWLTEWLASQAAIRRTEDVQRQAERVRCIRRWFKRQRLGCCVPVPDDLEEGARPRIPPKAAGRIRPRVGPVPAPTWVVRALKPRIGWARARRATWDYWQDAITFHDGRITRTMPPWIAGAWARGELDVGLGRHGEQLLTRRVPEPGDPGARAELAAVRRMLDATRRP